MLDLGTGGGPLFEYRVTRYDPQYRDPSGAFQRDEWTSVADVGRVFNGVVLTQEEYDRVEGAYVESALAFMREAGVSRLRIAGLEVSASQPLAYKEGITLSLEESGAVLKRVLREELWCRLEAPGAFVHVGYDYYMYIGVARLSPLAEEFAHGHGLFVEPVESPYRHSER